MLGPPELASFLRYGTADCMYISVVINTSEYSKRILPLQTRRSTSKLDANIESDPARTWFTRTAQGAYIHVYTDIRAWVCTTLAMHRTVTTDARLPHPSVNETSIAPATDSTSVLRGAKRRRSAYTPLLTQPRSVRMSWSTKRVR